MKKLSGEFYCAWGSRFICSVLMYGGYFVSKPCIGIPLFVFIATLGAFMATSYILYTSKPGVSIFYSLVAPITICFMVIELSAVYRNMNSNDFWHGLSFGFLTGLILNIMFVYVVTAVYDSILKAKEVR